MNNNDTIELETTMPSPGSDTLSFDAIGHANHYRDEEAGPLISRDDYWGYVCNELTRLSNRREQFFASLISDIDCWGESTTDSKRPKAPPALEIVKLKEQLSEHIIKHGRLIKDSLSKISTSTTLLVRYVDRFKAVIMLNQ